MSSKKETAVRSRDDWSPGVKAWVACYLAVQLLGVFMGAAIAALGELTPSVKDLQSITASTVGALLCAGFGLSLVPAAVYTPSLTAVVMACVRKRAPLWVSYGASVLLALPFFVVSMALFDPQWLPRCFADLNLFIFVAALLATSAAAAIAGTAAIHWVLGRTGYAKPQPEAHRSTPAK